MLSNIFLFPWIFFSLFRRFIHHHYKIFIFLLHIVATLRILNKDQKPNLTCVTFPLQTFWDESFCNGSEDICIWKVCHLNKKAAPRNPLVFSAVSKWSLTVLDGWHRVSILEFEFYTSHSSLSLQKGFIYFTLLECFLMSGFSFSIPTARYTIQRHL